jgi:small-conductance mechanosensitive channel
VVEVSSLKEKWTNMAMFRDFSWQIIIPILVLGATFIVGLAVRRLVFRTLSRWCQKTSNQADDLLVRAIRGPFMIWILMLGIHLAAQASPLPPKISHLISKVLFILLVLSVSAVAAKTASEMIRIYGNRLQGALPVTSLSQNLARLAVISIGLLLVLNSLGVSVTPILTALGVGGLAVALALQDTLTNLFAGFYVSLAGYIRLGDYIKLESGEEGYVKDIGWRSTTIRVLANNLIIIPNSKLSQAIVTNYHLPEKRMSLLVPVSVSYESNPEIIEKLLVEEAAKGAGEIPGLLAQPGPVVRFIPGFGSSSLDFTLICQISEFVDQYGAQHELRKRILARFRREGIEIPFPIRTVYMHADTKAGQRRLPDHKPTSGPISS